MLASLRHAADDGLRSPRIRNARMAKNAAHRRISRKERARYTSLMRFCGGLAISLCLVMMYVMLTARLTGLSYAAARAERERTALQGETARLDDRLAALRSDDRLASVAARLHMEDPQQFAIVTLPPPARVPDRSRLAVLAGLASLFGAK